MRKRKDEEVSVERDFEQKVTSMQIEHEQVKSAKKGDDVGMKINEKVHEGYKVYKK